MAPPRAHADRTPRSRAPAERDAPNTDREPPTTTVIYLYATWNVRGGRPLLADPRLRAAALAVLHDLCVEVAAVPVNLAALPNQLHLVVRMPPDHTVPWLVGRCKRRSSRLLLERFPALAETVGRQGLWSVGFYARLLEPAELGAVVRYITNGIQRAALHVAESPPRTVGTES